MLDITELPYKNMVRCLLLLNSNTPKKIIELVYTLDLEPIKHKLVVVRDGQTCQLLD